MRDIIAALDIGGTKILSALVTPGGEIVAHEQVPSEVPRGPLDAVQRIAASLDRLLAGNGLGREHLLAIGCSVPGPIDRANGIVVLSPNMKWYDFPLRAELQKHFPVPIPMDDDANCAALGESWRGAGRGLRDFIYLTVSTGVGSGLILDGRIYHGARDGAGEIGHAVVLPGGPPCSCGGAGCLEALCSGPSIANRARDALLHADETLIRTLVDDDPSRVQCETVFAAAAQGDAVALDILSRAGRYLGIGMANVAATLDPRAIILGGGVIAGGEPILGPAREAFRRHVYPPMRGTELRLAELGAFSCLWGAARMVLDDETA